VFLRVCARPDRIRRGGAGHPRSRPARTGAAAGRPVPDPVHFRFRQMQRSGRPDSRPADLVRPLGPRRARGRCRLTDGVGKVAPCSTGD